MEMISMVEDLQKNAYPGRGILTGGARTEKKR